MYKSQGGLFFSIRIGVHCYNYKGQGHIATECLSLPVRFVEHIDVNFTEDEEIMNCLNIQVGVFPQQQTTALTMNPLTLVEYMAYI